VGTLRSPRNPGVYRSFVYLNADEVINALSALEGGDVDEVLTRRAGDDGSDVGAELSVGVGKAKAGKRKGQRYEEEIRRKRTEHSATSLLLKKLHEEGAIGVVEGEYGGDVYGELREGLLLELKSNVRVHPLHQMRAAAHGWLRSAPGFGLPKADMKEMREIAGFLDALTTSSDDDPSVLTYAHPFTAREHRLLLPLHERFLLVGLDDLPGEATIVAQVARVLASDEEILAVRFMRDAPVLALERQGLSEALPGLLSGFRELGIDIDQDDVFLRHPTVVLRPICIYR